MISGMNYPGDPVAAMAGFYAAAYRQGARVWWKQAEIWRDALARAAMWPPAGLAAGVPLGPSLFGMVDPLIDKLSIDLVEAEDRIALSAVCRDVRLDIMISRVPDAEAETSVTLDGVAERIGDIKPEPRGT